MSSGTYYRCVSRRDLEGLLSEDSTGLDIRTTPAPVSVLANILDGERTMFRALGAVHAYQKPSGGYWLSMRAEGLTTEDVACLIAFARRLNATGESDFKWLPEGVRSTYVKTAADGHLMISLCRVLDDYGDNEWATMAAVPDQVPFELSERIDA